MPLHIVPLGAQAWQWPHKGEWDASINLAETPIRTPNKQTNKETIKQKIMQTNKQLVELLSVNTEGSTF